MTCDVKQGRHFYLICRDLADPKKKLFVRESEVLDQVNLVFRSIQVPTKLLDALLAHMKTSHEAENQFHRDAVAGLRREYDQTRDKLAVLLDIRLDKSITQDDYDRKARELKERQTEIASRRHLSAFENRAKASTDRLRPFEPTAQGEKARVFLAFVIRPDGQSGKLYELADEPVAREPASG